MHPNDPNGKRVMGMGGPKNSGLTFPQPSRSWPPKS